MTEPTETPTFASLIAQLREHFPASEGWNIALSANSYPENPDVIHSCVRAWSNDEKNHIECNNPNLRLAVRAVIAQKPC